MRGRQVPILTACSQNIHTGGRTEMCFPAAGKNYCPDAVPNTNHQCRRRRTKRIHCLSAPVDDWASTRMEFPHGSADIIWDMACFHEIGFVRHPDSGMEGGCGGEGEADTGKRWS